MGIFVTSTLWLVAVLFLSRVIYSFSYVVVRIKQTQISNLIKIRPSVAQLFQSDRRTDRRDETNSSFSQFCERE